MILPSPLLRSSDFFSRIFQTTNLPDAIFNKTSKLKSRASLARPFYPNLDPQPPLTNMFLKTFQFPSMYMHVHLMLTMNICCCCHIHSHSFSQEMKFRKQWPPKMVLPFHDGNGNRYLVAGSPFPATFSTANYASWMGKIRRV